MPGRHHHAGCLVPKQRGKDGRGAAMRRCRGAMDLMQLGMTDAAGKEFNEHLIRGGVGEVHLVNDQRGIRFDENGGFGTHEVKLLENKDEG